MFYNDLYITCLISRFDFRFYQFVLFCCQQFYNMYFYIAATFYRKPLCLEHGCPKSDLFLPFLITQYFLIRTEVGDKRLGIVYKTTALLSSSSTNVRWIKVVNNEL